MTATTSFPWLENVKFRRSQRARRLRINVSSRDGVVVTIPTGVSHARALAFVISENEWIEHHLTHMPPEFPLQPPETVALNALERVLTLQTTTGQHGPARLHEHSDHLLLTGAWNTDDAWCRLLCSWLREKAFKILPHALAEQANQMKLHPRRVSIRLQRTRWGSCNRHGDISLNAKLLLLEPALLKHVLIHELAHLLHLNHSPSFWAVVAAADPAWRQHKHALRAAAVDLPRWLER